MSIFEYNEEETIKAIGDTKFAAGKAEGKAEGQAVEREQGIRMLIETCQEVGVPREETLKKLHEKYDLDINRAKEYLQEYWK